jgi:hypothetical protein
MALVSVSSSMMTKVGYDAAQQLLYIVFSSGDAYCYYRVPPAVYAELLTADSLGRYFAQAIKGTYGGKAIGREHDVPMGSVATRPTAVGFGSVDRWLRGRHGGVSF